MGHNLAHSFYIISRLASETPRCGSAYEASSPDCKRPVCFASLRSVQGAGLACQLGRRFKAFHALRSPPEIRAPLRRFAAIPSATGGVQYRAKDRFAPVDKAAFLYSKTKLKEDDHTEKDTRGIATGAE